MLQYIICLVILFYICKTIGYAVYVFRDKNIIGGISVLTLAGGITVIFVASVMYIFK